MLPERSGKTPLDGLIFQENIFLIFAEKFFLILAKPTKKINLNITY
jgi:hypothetical protein